MGLAHTQDENETVAGEPEPRVLVGHTGSSAPGAGSHGSVGGSTPTPGDREPGTMTIVVNTMGGPDARHSEGAIRRLHAELHRLASIELGRERDRGALQTTALVHEALMKLGQFAGAHEWEHRGHFYGAAARAMREILLDAARRRRAEGRALRVVAGRDEAEGAGVELLELEEALGALERYDADLASLVVLRVFGGLSAEQAGEALGRSVRTVGRDWQVARAWLFRWLIDHGWLEGRGGR